MSLSALVVVPTYNERANLPVLVAGLMRHDNVRVLVVDDESATLQLLRGDLGGGVEERVLGRVQQHQLVYNALKGQMGGALHALALQTGLPEG